MVLKLVFGALLSALAFPVFAGCGYAIGRCSYINSTGEVRVADQVCLRFSCANVMSAQRGILFLNGAQIGTDYQVDTDTLTLNGQKGVEVFEGEADDEMSIQIRSSQGEYFISRDCNQDDPQCAKIYYPEFWDMAGFNEIDLKDIVLAQHPVKAAYDENNRLAVVYQQNDEGEIHTLTRGSSFEHLKLYKLIDLDQDGTDEIIFERTEMGTGADYIHQYEIFFLDDEGLYQPAQGNKVVDVAGRGLEFDDNTYELKFLQDAQGLGNTKLQTLYFRAVYEDGHVAIVSRQEPETIAAHPEIWSKDYTLFDINDENARAEMDFSYKGQTYQLSCAYWMRWGSFSGCEILRNDSIISDESVDLSSCKRIGIVENSEEPALVCNYNITYKLKDILGN